MSPVNPSVSPRPVGDYFGPTYSITFYASSEQALGQPDLPQFSGSSTDQALQLQQFNENITANAQLQMKLDKAQLDNYAAQLTIESTCGGPKQFTLNLTPPREDAIRIIDTRLIRMNSIVKVKWGYAPNLLTRDHYFRIIQPPRISYSKDVNISIFGVDIGSGVLKFRGTNISFSRDDFPDDFAILETLAGDMKLDIDDSDVPVTSTIYEDKDTPVPEIANDWELFKALCFDNNVTFTMEDNTTIKLHKIDEIVKQAPAYRFLYYQLPDNNKDIVLTSFTTNPIASVFFTPAIRNLMHVVTNLDKNETETLFIDHAALTDNLSSGETTDITVAGTGNETGKTLADGNKAIIPNPIFNTDEKGHSGDKLTQPWRVSNLDERAKQIVKETALAANTNAMLASPGMPDVFPPMCIRVEGVGDSFTGNYYVRKATHSLGRNGYDMNLDVYRTLTAPTAASGNKPVVPPTEKTVASENQGPAAQDPDSTPASGRASAN